MNYAILIGIEKYKFYPDILSPKYNTEVLKNILGKFNFEITCFNGFQLSTPDIIFKYFKNISTKIGKEDVVFIYYNGITKFFPKQSIYALSHPFSQSSKPSTFIELSELIDNITKILNNKVILVIDSKFEIPPSTFEINSDKLDFIITSNDINITNPWSVFTQNMYNELSIAYEFQKEISFNKIIESTQLSNERFDDTFDFFKVKLNTDFPAIFTPNQNTSTILDEYVINNIYNVSFGSRLDALNDLEYFYHNKTTEAEFEAAKTKLKYLAKSDKSEQIRRKAITILQNETSTSNKFDLNPIKKIEVYTPKFVHIEKGEFKMGVSNFEDEDLRNAYPEHSVFVDDFKISVNEITNIQYALFLYETQDEKIHTFPAHWESFEHLLSIKNHPVVNVNWYDCLSYCKWLQSKKIDKINDNEEITLPSEAEWEKACRGSDGRVYPWGNEFILDNSNNLKSKIGTTTIVGEYSPLGDSPYKCQDMAGNVWEWTRSIWGKSAKNPDFKYPYVANDGREDTNYDESFRRVIRGGGFYYDSNCVCCYIRNRAYVRHTHKGGGFRIVITKKKQYL